MGASILVLIAALAAVNALPIETVQNNGKNFVPGVFISSEALKDLQDKAQQNQNAAITNQGIQPITNAGRSVPGVSPSSQNDDPVRMGTAYPTNSNQQDVPQSQPSVVASQPILVGAGVQNQPALLTQNQPQMLAQPVVQPSNRPVLVSQPNQPILLSSAQPGYNQPPVYISQPPNNQFVSQPGQQIVLPNGQIAQIVSNVQPSVNGQPFVNNGQPLYISNNPGNQPLLVSTSSPGQFTVVQGSSPNTLQNPSTGVQYAMVSVGQNNLPPANTNLSNGNTGNTYLMVPSTNQVYAVSG